MTDRDRAEPDDLSPAGAAADGGLWRFPLREPAARIRYFLSFVSRVMKLRWVPTVPVAPGGAELTEKPATSATISTCDDGSKSACQTSPSGGPVLPLRPALGQAIRSISIT